MYWIQFIGFLSFLRHFVCHIIVLYLVYFRWLMCMYFAGGGIKLLVSAEAEETAHKGTSPTASKRFWTLTELFLSHCTSWLETLALVALTSLFANNIEQCFLSVRPSVTSAFSSQVPDGFIAHFYAVCEQISPVLAWGFLGSKSSLHDFCCFFKVSLSIRNYIRNKWLSVSTLL